ncbi:hypothetical protein FM102_14445 [Corynebacterium glutamicum]|nr:hypothetical protein FM102_14445 [Corynebacterium glutamicum]
MRALFSGTETGFGLILEQPDTRDKTWQKFGFLSCLSGFEKSTPRIGQIGS